MATMHQETMSFGIPVKYKCSKCGVQNKAVLPLTGSASKNIPDLTSKSRRKEIVRDLKYSAYSDLGKQIRTRYETNPIAWRAEIRTQKCTTCGNREHWMTTNGESLVAKVLGAIFAFAILAAGPILAAVMDSLILIVVVPFAGLALIIVGDKVYSRIDEALNGVKKQKEQNEIIEKCQPEYEISLDEALRAVGEKYQKSVEEE